MLGQRKKATHKEDNHQKKKWELDFADEEDLKIDNVDPKEIPQQESEDEKQSQNQESLEKNQKGISSPISKIK